MNRRHFIALLGVAAVAWPRAARAQTPGKLPRIGYLSDEGPSSNPFASCNSVLDGLRQRGYADGRNIIIEYRYAAGKVEQLPSLAADLVDKHVEVILAIGTPAAKAAMAATRTIPIVFARAGDPVGSGLVAGLAHPGGNATGVSILTTDLAGKRLEVLKDAVPRLSRVAVLYEQDFPPGELEIKQLTAAAPSLGVHLDTVGVGSVAALEGALPHITKKSPQALFVGSSGLFGYNYRLILDLALKSRLPALYVRREYVEAGGLISYGVSYREMFRLAADYIARILNGSKPADLPVQQPTKIELVINLKTTKALGLTIPPPLLALADEVIE